MEGLAMIHDGAMPRLQDSELEVDVIMIAIEGKEYNSLIQSRYGFVR